MRYSCSAASAATDRHSAYSLRFATITYRWHPLFGRTLQISPFRRGKELKCIYTDERPDLCRELPTWMFDESYCSGMSLGAAEISIEGLNSLVEVLAALDKTRTHRARSHSSKKEKDGAVKTKSKSDTARPRAGAPTSPVSSGAEDAGVDRGSRRSAPRSPRKRRADGEGRQR